MFSKTTTTTTIVAKNQGRPVRRVDPPVIEVVLAFDTTGSMYSYLEEVRKGLSALLKGLQSKTKKYGGVKLRVGVIAHGDYCDKGSSYVIKYLPLLDSTDSGAMVKLHRFVKEVGGTFGGDGPECYELVLRKASRAIGWGAKNSRRVLVMVGDNEPHPVGYVS